MEKFLVGYKGNKNVVGGDEEKKARKREYEVKSLQRSFLPSWKEKWAWLRYVITNGTGKMYCKVCRKHESSGTFVTGSQNFKVESIKAHQKSESHVKWEG